MRLARPVFYVFHKRTVGGCGRTGRRVFTPSRIQYLVGELRRLVFCSPLSSRGPWLGRLWVSSVPVLRGVSVVPISIYFYFYLFLDPLVACKVDVSCEALELASAQAKGFLLKWSAECLPLLRRSPALGHTHYRGGGDGGVPKVLGYCSLGASWAWSGFQR